MKRNNHWKEFVHKWLHFFDCQTLHLFSKKSLFNQCNFSNIFWNFLSHAQYLNEASWNWRLMKTIMTKCHVHDKDWNYVAFDELDPKESFFFIKVKLRKLLVNGVVWLPRSFKVWKFLPLDHNLKITSSGSTCSSNYSDKTKGNGCCCSAGEIAGFNNETWKTGWILVPWGR